MHAMSFNPGHVHQSEQSGMPPPHTLLPPVCRRHATIQCTQGCHRQFCSEKQCGLVSLIIGANQGQQTHGPEQFKQPQFGEFSHFMQAKDCQNLCGRKGAQADHQTQTNVVLDFVLERNIYFKTNHIFKEKIGNYFSTRRFKK